MTYILLHFVYDWLEKKRLGINRV